MDKMKKLTKLMKDIGRVAEECGFRAFLVGGTVRDLMLGRMTGDIDVAIEGDAIEVGRVLAKALGAPIVEHKKFGTCTIAKKDLRIDLAAARKEQYAKPGALPDVSFSSLEDDLSRRDFTINAMAISLSKDTQGELFDFFGGQQDLQDGIIRAIHDGSFIDDPTRIFRAVRFEQRFGYKIDRHTEDLIKDAIKKDMLNKISRGRAHNEIDLISKEKDADKMLKRMAGFEREMS